MTLQEKRSRRLLKQAIRIETLLSCPWLRRWGILALVFLLAFLPRAIHPVSRAMLWYSRSIRFSDAVLSGDLAATNIRHHPGVTVMWLSGFGLQLFARLRGLTSEYLLGLEPTPIGVIDEAVAAGVLPLALAIALCVALCYPLVRRLAGRRVAVAAAVLLALNPFHIARSQVLHLDALLATFMLLSALFLLNHLHYGRRVDLILSGVFGGLSVLTKSPALFLVPYAALAVGMHQMTARDHWRGGWRWWWRWLAVILGKVALWALVAAVIFVALWPAMWVEPLEVLSRMGRGISLKVEEAHHNPIFFNGRVLESGESPGPLFYLATVGWKTTLVTLPMLGVAIVWAVVRLRSDRREGIGVLLLAAYAVFFTAQMCLGARQAPRYILPAFLALDVMAAFGVVWAGDAAAEALAGRRMRWLPAGIAGALLVLQASMTLPRHPYYGTLYNPLLGGARSARHVLPLQEEGEGLELAAGYLNTLPDAPNTIVGVDRNAAAMFGRNFIGSPSEMDDPAADFRAYTVNQVMRQLHLDEWGRLFALDRQGDPVYTVSFGGVPYVRVYRNAVGTPAPTAAEYEVHYHLGDHIRLQRVRLNTDLVIPSSALIVRPYWTSDGQVERSYKVFWHLLSADRELLAQRDDLPLGGSRPTPTWQPGEVIEDRYKIDLGRDAEPGRYELSLGMYDAETMERLPAYTAGGERVLNDRIVLGVVEVANIAW